MPEPRASLIRRLFRPRLSLRLTMAAVLLVAVGLGCVITGARRQAETVEMVRSLGGEVQYDWQYRDFADSGNIPPPGSKWLLDLVGPDYFHDVTLIQFKSNPTPLDEALVVRFGELRQLEVLRLGLAPAISDDGFARLSGLTRMQKLNLSGTGVSGRAFEHLLEMKGLQFLVAMKIATLDADLANLSNLTSLKSLFLQGDQLTDAGLAHLRPLKNIGSLQIVSDGPMQITSAGLAHLSGMTNLFQLLLCSTKVDSLEPIRGLTSLTSLHFFNASLDDESLAPLANFTKIEGLTLTGKDQKFGDAGLAYLAGLKSLNGLFLGDTKVGDAGLAHLAGLSNLEYLNLDGTRVTDAGLAQLAKLPKLKTLSLCRTAINDAGLAQLAGLAGCKEIMLKETKMTPAGITALRAKLPGVRIDQ